MSKHIFKIRDAKKQSTLPPKLRDCWLMGYFDKTFYLASEKLNNKGESTDETDKNKIYVGYPTGEMFV